MAPGPSGVAIRARLRLSETDMAVLAEVGLFLGSLAAQDLAARSRQGLEHGASGWAVRQRELTGVSSARWAGSITKVTHDQWALARRGQAAEMAWLRGQIASIEARLARPLGAKANKREVLPRGYASRSEWHGKSRRLHALKDRLAALEADWAAGKVHVVRGGKRLAQLRHHLEESGLDESGWRQRWQAARMFLAADGESGKRFGNETIRITDTGQISIRLPAALAHLANAPHGRYVLDATVAFQHRGEEWRDRITANRAVAYRIHHDFLRGRWYVTASWQQAAAPVLSLEAALARGVVGGESCGVVRPPRRTARTACGAGHERSPRRPARKRAPGAGRGHRRRPGPSPPAGHCPCPADRCPPCAGRWPSSPCCLRRSCGNSPRQQDPSLQRGRV